MLLFFWFMLLFSFSGNFLRNTSAEVSGSIPGHGWVFVLFLFYFCFVFSSLFYFFQWKFSGFGSQHFKSLLRQYIQS